GQTTSRWLVHDCWRSYPQVSTRRHSPGGLTCGDAEHGASPSGWQALRRPTHVCDRETDEKGRPAARPGGERELAKVLVHHDRSGEGETLPGAPADLLGGEELVEDLVFHIAGDTASVVFHRDEGCPLLTPGANADAARPPGVPIGDGMSGVDDEVEEDLAKVAPVTRHRRENAE